MNNRYAMIGGTEKYLFQVCDALEARGHEILIVADAESLLPATADAVRRFAEGGGKVVLVNRAPDRAPGLAEAMREVAEYQQEMARRLDAALAMLRRMDREQELEGLASLLARMMQKQQELAELRDAPVAEWDADLRLGVLESLRGRGHFVDEQKVQRFLLLDRTPTRSKRNRETVLNISMTCTL